MTAADKFSWELAGPGGTPYPLTAATTSCIIPESMSISSPPAPQPAHSSPFGSIGPEIPPVLP